LGTNDSDLVEHTKRDKFWADGGDHTSGKGVNMLGKLLMKLRKEIRKEEAEKNKEASIK
jgi:predicted NAD-dependent protein-ADP-ribosyltransferase YbiA (DUF1768 family)